MQFTVAFPSGQPGGAAASAVGEASRREAVCATTPPRPTVGGLARGPMQKRGAVSTGCVQVHLVVPQRDTLVPSPRCGVSRRSALSSNVSDGVVSHLRAVDGSWSDWSPWEECTRSCGRGNRTRTRTCNNPSAQHGGRPCEGAAVEMIMCNVRPCPGETPLRNATFLCFTPTKGLQWPFLLRCEKGVWPLPWHRFILRVLSSVSWINLWR